MWHVYKRRAAIEKQEKKVQEDDLDRVCFYLGLTYFIIYWHIINKIGKPSTTHKFTITNKFYQDYFLINVAVDVAWCY